MVRKKILNENVVKKVPFAEAEKAFFKFCVLKNLRPASIEYYREDLHYFQQKTGIKFVEGITQNVYDDFIYNELQEGKKTTSLNARIRGLRVFFNFCVDREYISKIEAKLLKTDEELKEP